MTDEDDAVTGRRQATKHGEDLTCLLRRQYRRGLVEDQDPRLAIERFEDLDALLPAHGQRLDASVRIDVEAELVTQCPDPLTSLLPVEEDAVRHRLFAEQDVVRDG